MMHSPDSTRFLPPPSRVYDGVLPTLLTVSSSTTAMADSMAPGTKYSMNVSTTSVFRSGRSEGQMSTYSPSMTLKAWWRSSMKLSPDVRTVSAPMPSRNLSVTGMSPLTDTRWR